MAGLLVPAFLDPNHIRHAEIVAAVQGCKSHLAGVADATAATSKPRGSLATVVELTQGAKLPLLGKRAKAFAGTVKRAPERGKPTRRTTR